MTEEMYGLFVESAAGQGNGGLPFWTQVVEVSERDGNYEVRADLPGLKPEDLKVEVTGNALVIEGCDPAAGRRQCRPARARFENGALEVTVPVPKREPADSDRRKLERL